MVKHFYGSVNLLEKVQRSHMFINELNLYIDYLQEEVQTYLNNVNEKKKKHLDNFKLQLENGIAYYKKMFGEISGNFSTEVKTDLLNSEKRLLNMTI